MWRAAATLAAVAAAATCAPTAHADLAVGVADDRGKYAEDGGASFFGTLRELGLSENRMTVPRVVFPSRRLGRGTYVYRIELATMNPARTSVFVSRPFVVR